MYAVKEVTEEVFDSQLEVSLKDAVALNGAYEIGDKIRLKLRQRLWPHCCPNSKASNFTTCP